MHVVSVLVPYLIGAATTLAVQWVIELGIRPRADSRRRREERFERDVLTLGELMTTTAGEKSGDACVALGVWRDLRATPDISQNVLDEVSEEARRKTSDYSELFFTRITWLADRITAFMPNADDLQALRNSFRTYAVQVLLVTSRAVEDNSPEDKFEERWDDERYLRREFINQIKKLANMQHPPRTTQRHRIKQIRQRIGQEREHRRNRKAARDA